MAAVALPDASAEDYKWHLQLSFQPENYADHKRQQLLGLAALPAIHAATAQRLPSAMAATDAGCTAQSSALSLPGLVEYIVENDRYRITEVQDYLDTFTGDDQANRNVDLMVAHLVDYDWWLKKGTANGTTLQRQVDVMAEISVYTRGQVHAFAAFDPLREVAYRCRAQHPSHKLWSSLDFVQKAVRERGCLGVKLYPPMGFGASGNANQPHDIWNLPGVPAWLSDGSFLNFDDHSVPAPFGARLDQVLEELFAWCEAEGVPIMAHALASNGQNWTLEALAEAQYWAPVIKDHPCLRLNFGHLGDLAAIPPCAPTIPPQAANLMALFTASNKAYGDSGFDSEILGTGIELTQERYAAAYNVNPLLATRMLYGTDWNLLLHIGNVQDYQKRFQALADGLPNADSVVGGHTVRERFLGWNAVDYLGLRMGEPNRIRLEAFYKANGLDTSNPTNKPEWMTKVDKVS
jgi:predicted TIM-barrel fold metal-dependent hydrolase